MSRRIAGIVLLGAGAAVAAAQEGTREKDPAHVMVTPSRVAWGEPRASFPKRARVAILTGDPTKAGPFTFRLGKGDTFDLKALHATAASPGNRP